jgi:hypothetical protein
MGNWVMLFDGPVPDRATQLGLAGANLSLGYAFRDH